MVFLKNGPNPASFCLFRSFYMTNTAQILWMKKLKWCAWHSNPGWQDGRCRRIHWAMAAPQFVWAPSPAPVCKFEDAVLSAYWWSCTRSIGTIGTIFTSAYCRHIVDVLCELLNINFYSLQYPTCRRPLIGWKIFPSQSECFKSILV